MHIKHYYTFKNSEKRKRLTKDEWDALRKDKKEKDFSFENTAEEYLKMLAQKTEYYKVAKIISKIIRKKDIRNIVSLGSGKGVLEYDLKELLPDVHIVCTDYAGVDTLKKYTNCDDCFQFDMLEGNYSDFGDGTCLIMHRISTEFNRKQWKKIFSKIYNSKVETVIFVPTEIATITYMLNEMKEHWKNYLIGKKDTMCGWLYSQNEFEYFLTNSYKNRNSIEMGIPFQNTRIYVVNIRR